MTHAIRKRIAGDWLVDGYIDNLGRQRCLELVIVGTKAYDADMYDFGFPLAECELVGHAHDDTITAWGASTRFSPDEGEIERVARECFGYASL